MIMSGRDARGPARLLGGLNPEPDRAADAGAAQAAIAAWILGEVLLVIVLGAIERRSVQDPPS
jgi:hypothetical protein